MSASYSEHGTPVRYPDASSPRMMTRRAWWLVLLGALIPGSAQVLAGSRRLGRFGLGATLLLWTTLLAAAVTWWLWPSTLFTVATNSWVLLAGQALLAFYAALWLLLALDTMRLTRLVKTWPGARGFIAGLAVMLMIGTAGVAAYGSYIAGIARSTIDEVFADGGYAQPIDGRYNILLLGGDAGADRLGLRPDSISVVSIHAASGATTIIGIPRNLENAPFSEGSPLYGPFPNGYDCGTECLISYLHTYGTEHPELYPDAEAAGSTPGIEATRDAVEGVLGMQVPYYALIDMKGFSSLIDALGGVSITVKERLPIGGGVSESGQPNKVHGWIERGEQRMNGYTALWYARSRASTDDYDRMKRQRDVQAAVLAQFEPATVLTRFQGIADAGKQIVKTDIPQAMLGRFVELAGLARGQELRRVELVPPKIDTANPNYEQLRALVQKGLIIVTPTPTTEPG